MKLNNYDREAAEGMLYMIVSSFEDDLEEIMILSDEGLDYGGWFFSCRLFYNDGMKMDVPFVYYEGNDWVFTPCDWQSGNLPTEAKEIGNINWRVDDTETEGIIFDGQPVLAPWIADIRKDAVSIKRKDIGRQIAEVRKSQGLTVRDLSEKCGLAANHISRIETGKYNYNIDTLIQIADALGLTVETQSN